MQAARHPDNPVCVRLFLLPQIALKWFVDVHDRNLEKKKDILQESLDGWMHTPSW
jgi:hypothetical protein